jgi:tryptophanyl-tRNA synthetase
LRNGVESFYFLADYHALIKIDDPARIQRSTLEIAASWLAAGLNPERVTFYRQSDVPEIPELTWFLTCVTGKGILNRAHAYKASVDKNTHAGLEPDADVTAGLFMYPVLMGADILMFNAHHVPVGRDQIQHIEMARDMAHSFNHRYGEHFVPPLAAIEESVATLPGLDGRKMSKSYDNTIPLFAPREQLKKLIAGIKTDSLAPGVAKDTEGSALFQIYQAFASSEETATMAKLFAQGIGWGEAKEKLFERIDQEIAPMRERYQFLMDNPKEVQSILQLGAIKARSVATPFMATLRQAVGLRNLASETQTGVKKSTKTSGAVFKQYREKDGLFYFKFVDTKGELLIQSPGFESPKLAGLAIAQLKAEGIKTLGSPMDTLNASTERIEAALQSLREEE